MCEKYQASAAQRPGASLVWDACLLTHLRKVLKGSPCLKA